MAALAAALLDREAPLGPVEEHGLRMLRDIGVDPGAFGRVAKIRGAHRGGGDGRVHRHDSLSRSRSTTRSVRPQA
jgi:hypothetical protein